MSSAEVLARLAAADVRLAVDGDRLRLGAPSGRPLAPGLLAQARAAKPALQLVASGAWQRELEAWPPFLREEWEERAAFREVDGQQGRSLAERAAFLEIREASLAPVASAVAEASAALGPVTLGLGASTAPAGHHDLVDGQDEGPAYRPDPRPIVHPLCCGGCGTKGLTLEGLGPCCRCGWRRLSRG